MIELKKPVKTLNEFLERIKDLRRGWPSKNKPTRQGEQLNGDCHRNCTGRNTGGPKRQRFGKTFRAEHCS